MPPKRKDYYALVVNLLEEQSRRADETCKPYIIQAGSLYCLNADNEARRFRPKNDRNFDTTREYGRKMVVNGEMKLVRHLIKSLNSDIAPLKELHDSMISADTTKRAAIPKRVSLGPVCESLKEYTFPEEDTEKKAQKAAKRKDVNNVKISEGNRIAQKYKKMKNKASFSESNLESENLINKQLSDDKDKSSESHDKSAIASNKQSSAGLDTKATTCPSNKDSEKNPSPDVEDLSLFAEKMVEDEKIKKESEISCEVIEHQRLKSQLDQALRDKEEALKEVGELKDRLFEKDKKCNDMDLRELRKEVNGIKEIVQSIQECVGARFGVKEGEIVVPKTKVSNILSLSNLVVGDSEVVHKDKIKVDTNKYVNKNDVQEVEKKTNFTSRVTGLCELFCEYKSYKFSVSDKNKETRITDTQMNSMLELLKNMLWTKSERLSIGRIRDRLIRFTSDCRSGRAKNAAEKEKQERLNTKDAEGKSKKKKRVHKDAGHDSKHSAGRKSKHKSKRHSFTDEDSTEEKGERDREKRKQKRKSSDEESDAEQVSLKKYRSDEDSYHQKHASKHHKVDAESSDSLSDKNIKLQGTSTPSDLDSGESEEESDLNKSIHF